MLHPNRFHDPEHQYDAPAQNTTAAPAAAGAFVGHGVPHGAAVPWGGPAAMLQATDTQSPKYRCRGDPYDSTGLPTPLANEQERANRPAGSQKKKNAEVPASSGQRLVRATMPPSSVMLAASGTPLPAEHLGSCPWSSNDELRECGMAEWTRLDAAFAEDVSAGLVRTAKIFIAQTRKAEDDVNVHRGVFDPVRRRAG
eukprot:CAMPEP_0174847124 /NCGR_PEP_ID=MMETSP1114-20130205/12723_1 /TAXON_ID=312471 /ORGANISM="Neobodo designis, Strain CCAP 1951/1" /LENGTH=197 /DNA_ID=CAMNT_0016081395 /DNA_START=58 /DNA_END=648 /DNA_ORIENTATION=-